MEDRRAYRAPDHVAWIDGTDVGEAAEFYLTVVPDGGTVQLKDTGRLIWLTAAAGGDTVQEIAALVGLAPDAVEQTSRPFSPIWSRGGCWWKRTIPALLRACEGLVSGACGGSQLHVRIQPGGQGAANYFDLKKSGRVDL